MPSLIPRSRLHSRSRSSQDATRPSRPADDVTVPVAPQQTQHLQGGKPATSANTDRGPHDGFGGAGTRAAAEIISTRASPAVAEHDSKDSSGLFNRLLQRGKSLKRKPRPSHTRGISGPDQLPASRPDEGAIASTSAGPPKQQQGYSNSPQISTALQRQAQQQDLSRATPIGADPAPRAETTAAPVSQSTNPTTQPSGENTSGLSEMAKPITRKPSLRDRFRLKSSATPSPEEQQKRTTPVIYIPKHAAADFSRMAVTSRPRTGYSFDEDRTLSPRFEAHGVDANVLTKELEELQIKPNRHSSTLQPLPEAESDAHVHRVQLKDDAPPKQELRRGHSRNQSVPTSRPRGHRQRPSQTSPAEAGETQVHRHNASTASAPFPTSARQQVEQRLENQAVVQTQQPTGMSDYELFIRRAEEEDRAERDRMFYGLPYRAKPKPPVNPFYTTNFAPVSAPAPALDDIHESEPRGQTSSQPSDAPLVSRAGLAAGGGSKSSGTRTRRDSSQYQLHSGPLSAGNTNRGSWPTSNEAEREKERKVSGAIPEYTLPVDANYVGASSGVQYQSREPRGLKRQGSITQRIAEYIKPSRDRSKYAQPVSPGAVPRQ